MPSRSATENPKKQKSKQGSQHSYSNLPSGQTPLDRYISEASAHEQFTMSGSSQRSAGQQTVQQWDTTWNQASKSS